MNKGLALANNHLALRLDARGRIISLRHRATKREWITRPAAAGAWHMVLPTGGHRVAFLDGAAQPAPTVSRSRDGDAATLRLTYARLELAGRPLAIRAEFALTLRGDTLTARVSLANDSDLPVDEVEFPVVGGLGGAALELVTGQDRGVFHGNALARLPDTGRASNHFVRELETAMFPVWHGPVHGVAVHHPGAFLDLAGEGAGLYAGLHPATPDERAQLFAFKLEKHPKEVPCAAHNYPAGTPRWLRLSGLFMPRVPPGGRWQSPPLVLAPHAGDWHAGADHYAAYRHAGLTVATPPAWLRDFVGWTEILGQTYLGEVFHDYARCATEVTRDAAVTGLNLVFYYGHTTLGAEGADFDNGPAAALGGEAGFRAMVDALHAQGVRVILLDHVHRWVNRAAPEYAALGLDAFAMRDEFGRPHEARWWKETGLSCLYCDGPTPIWHELCPACPGFQQHYVAHVRRMVALGVDGLELDTFNPGVCYHPGHPHAPGANLMPAKLALVAAARAVARRANPDFIFLGETMVPETRAVLDGFYPNRYLDEHGRIHRYLFPELREQAVLVGNYAFDQVNKAVQLGIGVDVEADGLRRTALAACPELARYLGVVNAFRRQHADLMLQGTFRDTVGATVSGGALYSVLVAADGRRAVVLRNPRLRPTPAAITAIAAVAGRPGTWRLWRPRWGAADRPAVLPLRTRLAPYDLVVLFEAAQ